MRGGKRGKGERGEVSGREIPRSPSLKKKRREEQVKELSRGGPKKRKKRGGGGVSKVFSGGVGCATEMFSVGMSGGSGFQCRNCWGENRGLQTKKKGPTGWF